MAGTTVATSYRVSGLESCRTYYFRVRTRGNGSSYSHSYGTESLREDRKRRGASGGDDSDERASTRGTDC